MKLVDILARELKVWPEGVDSVWQSSCDNEIYFDSDVPPFYTSLNAEDSGTQGAVITQAQWQAAVDALNAPKVVEKTFSFRDLPIGPACFREATAEEKNLIGWYMKDGKFRTWLGRDFREQWDGSGDPPPMSKIEYKSAEGLWKLGVFVGRVYGKIVAGCDDTEVVGWLSSGEMRPIRTAEQVAAEERDKGIQEICATLGWLNIRSDGSAQEAAILYDAGYRKEPKPCGS